MNDNVGINEKEHDERLSVLTSTPKLVTLGTHNSCNAKCVFCLEGAYPRFTLDRYKEFFEGRMGRFIRQAEKVTFTGFGEVLLVQDALAFLDYVNDTIPDIWKIFTTNGTPLTEEVISRLLKSRYVVQLSLHAADAKRHEELTLLKGAYSGIIESARKICRLRRERDLGDRLHMVLVNVVTRKSVDGMADIVRLAWDLQVPEVRFNYVTMFSPDHIAQSCFFEQERANRAIDAAREELRTIEVEADPEEFKYFQVRLPEKFGESSGELRGGGHCADPWQHVYVESQGPVLPCCNWGVHAGNLEKGDSIDGLWNGEFYRSLRRSMGSDTPHPWCAHCVNYRGYNVDSLLCHLTNRPDQQRKLLREIERRGATDVSGYLTAVGEAEKCVPC